ncbi:MAG: hypothetical protein KDD54_10925 [Flavobacteriales bacterium]|nr:hypothetical protein [Flavobacteriales bacterium]
MDNIDVHVNIDRFDKDLFDTLSDSVQGRISYLSHKYGSFFDMFSFRIIAPARGIADPGFSYNLSSFTTHPDMREAYNQCQKVFPDLSWLENEMSLAFRHYKYYFPEKNVPRVIAFMSGFNYSVAVDSDFVAIGLERYLGPDCVFYPSLQYPKYMTAHMDKPYITPDCMRAWALSEWPQQGKKNFLGEIIYNGKLLYFLRSMMPDLPDAILFRYTPEKLEWCNDHEAYVWAELIDEKLLFITEEKKIVEWTSEAPFVQGFTREAPDRVGNWVGYQIVSAYMERENVSLDQLMGEQDAQMILEKSHYKP